MKKKSSALGLDKVREKEIREEFEKLGIPQDLHKEYNDPYSFAYNFKPATVLESVPLTSSGSSIPL